jgi:ATP-binding cassette subfamily C protein
MDDTLRRNIALGVPDDLIDDQAVNEAIRLAQLDDFVASLPNGLDTQVGELGVRLSGGQRQRVAIARALYRRPGVLVFDEGTSALDNVTEAQLVEMLEQVRGERTIMVVAHRLSSVRACDYIVFVDEGRVIAVAPFGELIETNPAFRDMAART